MWKKVIYKGIVTSLAVNEKGEVYNYEKDMYPKLFVNTNGYVTASIPKIRKQYRVHRMVAEAFIDNPNNYPYVNHIDGNKENNSVENLEWVTAQMNTQHAELHHLVNHARGESSGANVYPEEKIREVCVLLEKRIPCTEISKMTGVSRSVVTGVKFGKIWKHVFKDYNIPQIRRKTYPEINSLVDDLIAIGVPRKECVDKLLDLIDSRKLAGQIFDRRMREAKRQMKKHKKH